MTKYNYYLEDIERSDSADTDIHKAVISCREHGNCEEHQACIVIYGDDYILTERVIKALKGLNE
jgi:hypothetical protein